MFQAGDVAPSEFLVLQLLTPPGDRGTLVVFEGVQRPLFELPVPVGDNVLCPTEWFVVYEEELLLVFETFEVPRPLLP